MPTLSFGSSYASYHCIVHALKKRPARFRPEGATDPGRGRAQVGQPHRADIIIRLSLYYKNHSTPFVDCLPSEKNQDKSLPPEDYRHYCQHHK